MTDEQDNETLTRSNTIATVIHGLIPDGWGFALILAAKDEKTGKVEVSMTTNIKKPAIDHILEKSVKNMEMVAEEKV